MANAIEEILKKRDASRGADESAESGDKFFSILVGEGHSEHFLELRFRDGSSTCFSYTNLSWFNHMPEDGLDLDFDGYMISIRGRGLAPRLFTGIKQKRVAWVKEADVELQDHPGNECFISEISILPPPDYTGESENS